MSIKSMELEPTKENLLATLKENLLNRNTEILRFVRFCQMQEGKCSIAIDANWGAGKTFFVKQVKMLIEAYNPLSKELQDDEKKYIQSIFAAVSSTIRDEFEKAPQICVYYDAWANDNDSDPILSIVHEITKNTTLEYDLRRQTDYLGKAASIIEVFTGKNTKNLVESLRTKDYISYIQSQKDVHKIIEDFLDSLLAEQGNRLVVFIDELDRCKPTFAIQLLERIKHYFSNDRITFVFSINDTQLQHSIRRYYGADFDSCRYLDRFFDYRISLPHANMRKYYEKIGFQSYDVFGEVCRAMSRRQKMELRELEKYARISRFAVNKQLCNQTYYTHLSSAGLDFVIYIIVPIMIGLKMTNNDDYHRFIEGKDPQPLLDILADGTTATGIITLLFERTESQYDSSSDTTEQSKIKDKLYSAYNALFCADSNDRNETKIGQCVFNSSLKDEATRIISLLSQHADY